MTSRLIYVAGAVGPNDRGRIDRIHDAIDIAEKIRRLGCRVFVPHLFHYFDARHPRSYDEWMDECFFWVDRADSLFRMNNVSPGADREVARMRSLGRPVFYQLAEVEEWLRPRERNQCDGCQAGIPVDEHGTHHMSANPWDLMSCEAERYGAKRNREG